MTLLHHHQVVSKQERHITFIVVGSGGVQGRFLNHSESFILSSSQELCSACLIKNKIEDDALMTKEEVWSQSTTESGLHNIPAWLGFSCGNI